MDSLNGAFHELFSGSAFIARNKQSLGLGSSAVHGQAQHGRAVHGKFEVTPGAPGIDAAEQATLCANVNVLRISERQGIDVRVIEAKVPARPTYAALGGTEDAIPHCRGEHSSILYLFHDFEEGLDICFGHTVTVT